MFWDADTIEDAADKCEEYGGLLAKIETQQQENAFMHVVYEAFTEECCCVESKYSPGDYEAGIPPHTQYCASTDEAACAEGLLRDCQNSSDMIRNNLHVLPNQ